MSHRILISADWAAAQAWLLDCVAARIAESPLSCVRVVAPANTLVKLTSHLAIVNREPTPADGWADVAIHGGAGDTLSALAEAVL